MNTPPTGYQMPQIVADLIAHAEAHGWATAVQWRTACDDAPYVIVDIARRRTPQEAAEHRANPFYYSLTWHSRGCAPGRLRRFGAGIARTPERRRYHDAPSVRAIREVITANSALTR
ncbi:hypothetical protein ACFWPV_10005 [Streptomyces uncialis]|uniref:hypothetical protein n=1 Tax=Streptomyces uncialis TaxID=1048205 RepID=UPI00365A21CB